MKVAEADGLLGWVSPNGSCRSDLAGMCIFKLLGDRTLLRCVYLKFESERIPSL